jgi:hypothetical protein
MTSPRDSPRRPSTPHEAFAPQTRTTACGGECTGQRTGGWRDHGALQATQRDPRRRERAREEAVALMKDHGATGAVGAPGLLGEAPGRPRVAGEHGGRLWRLGKPVLPCIENSEQQRRFILDLRKRHHPA